MSKPQFIAPHKAKLTENNTNLLPPSSTLGNTATPPADARTVTLHCPPNLGKSSGVSPGLNVGREKYKLKICPLMLITVPMSLCLGMTLQKHSTIILISYAKYGTYTIYDQSKFIMPILYHYPIMIFDLYCKTSAKSANWISLHVNPRNWQMRYAAVTE